MILSPFAFIIALINYFYFSSNRVMKKICTINLVIASILLCTVILVFKLENQNIRTYLPNSVYEVISIVSILFPFVYNLIRNRD
jgi:formate-dependent nitrite reductase membrane component NrfD